MEIQEFDIFETDGLPIYEIDGSLVSSENADLAKSFIDQLLSIVKKEIQNIMKKDILMNEYPSLGALLLDSLKTHHVYSRLDDSHLRLIYWHISMLELKYPSIADFLLNENKTQSQGLKGGLGQLTHCLAFGLNKAYFPLDVECDKNIDHVLLKNPSLETKPFEIIDSIGGVSKCDYLVFFLLI